VKAFYEKWKSSLHKLGWERRLLLSAALLSAIPAVGRVLMQSTTDSAPVERAAAVDTLIPKGFVLVPIEVQNYESLDSILGRFGVVDLFQPGSQNGDSQRLVARNVRILRAPQNPSHFAVLIREEEVPRVLQQGGLFTVIVKRPQNNGTEFVNTEKPKRRKIIYEGG
jgi:hypothetical protein